MRSQEPVPRDDCFEDNMYEADNILLDNVDPLGPDSFPRFTPINKTMYLSFSSESMFKTAIAAIAMKPEFDAWLNQKKNPIATRKSGVSFQAHSVRPI